LRIFAWSVVAVIAITACSAPSGATTYHPQASSSGATQTGATRTQAEIAELMARPGSLGVTSDAFVTAWNAAAQARNFPSLHIPALSTTPDGDLASAAVDFSPYLRLEAKVNPDGSLRSVAVRDRSVTIDLSKVVHGDDALEFAVLPPTAALARNILGGATNPRLSAAEQAHLAAAVVGSDDPVALGSFGKTPVFATLDEKGVRYTFLTDVAGNLWYIAQAAGSGDVPSGEPGASPSG
jgi:hypothetical protein